jgi:hypothetical protein
MTPPIQKSGGIGGFLGKAAPVLGVIGDALLAANGRPGIYTPMIAQEREQQRREQNALDQWRQEYDYKVSHPAPLQPTDQQRNFQAYQGMNPQTQQAFLRYQDAVNPRFTNTTNGTSFVPRVGGPSQAAPSIPPKPDGMTNDQILAQAYAAARSGANVEDIFRRLQAWGVQP